MKNTYIGRTNFTSLYKSKLLLFLKVRPTYTYFITSFELGTR